MGILIDSTALIAVERASGELGELLAPFADEPVAIATATAAELLHGVLRANTEQRRSQRERFVEEVLRVVPVLPFDLEAARIYARLWVDLQAAGAGIGVFDLMIAATALRHDCRLLTHNVRHFKRCEGLEVLIA